MTALVVVEKWFHATVLRHPRFTATTPQMEPIRTICWCGIEWRRR